MEEEINDSALIDDYEQDIPKREDYEWIHQFKLYELTQCITYELAKKNESVQKILKEIEDAPLFSDKEIEEYHQKTQDPEFQKKHENLVAVIPSNKNTEELKKKLIDEYLIYPKGSSKKILGVDTSSLEQALLTEKILKKKLSNYTAEKKECEGYDILKGMYNNEPNFETSIITPNFQRAVHDINQTFVSINFSLPPEEIIAYIKKIQEDLRNNEDSLIKDPYEILEKELNLNIKEFKDFTAIEWADCFYIYDYYKKTKDKNIDTFVPKIQLALNKYHYIKISNLDAEEIIKINNIEDKELRKKEKKRIKYRNISYSTYEMYKDKYQSKSMKHYSSTRTIKERQKIMYALIDIERYKTLILNKRIDNP